MSLPIARMIDKGFGIDSCHDDPKPDRTGEIIASCGNVMVNGLPVARMTDYVMRGDGHYGVIIGGSGTVIAGGLPVARLNDAFVGCFTGILIQGSGNVMGG